MIEKVKKYGIIIIIAILFTAFSFSIVDVVMQPPRYEDFCFYTEKPYMAPQEKADCLQIATPSPAFESECRAKEGMVRYNYDSNGCATGFECSTCEKEFNDSGKTHRLVGFIITGLIGVIAIMLGMYAFSRNMVLEWVYSGLLIGGILSIFIGTMSYFHDMGRFVKPFILLGEMVLIIWIAVRTAARAMKRK